MDDLYGNAWGDPLNDYSNPHYPLPTWNARPPPFEPPSPVEDDQKNIHANDDENEDVSTETQFRTDASDTSWTTDAVPWPVEENQDQYHTVWAPASPANAWSSTVQPQTPTVPTPTPSNDIPPESPPLASPTLPEEPREEHPIPSEQPQDAPVQPRAPSPDQFGTFESGNTDTTIHAEGVRWGSPKYSTFDDSVDSSNAWDQQAATKKCDTEAEPVDEWEAARRMKEKLDRRVPTEVIASIIETFEQFSEKMWPEGSSSGSQPQEEWLQSWRRGFDSVDDLNNIIGTLLPEYTFVPRVPFAKSAVAKEMTKSLRFTRHSAVTRLSPMAHFMRNKGSSSDWEAAVKNRSDEVPDDMPVGWRIMEKKGEVPAPVETKKRSGLFSSFWNRREGSTSSLPSIPDAKTSLVQDSPTEPSSTKSAPIVERTGTLPTVPSRTASQSPRQSVEGRRSQSVSSNRLTKPPPVPPVVTASVSASPANTIAPVSSIGQSLAEATTSPIDPTAATDGPAQSAVSRFLNRFSRPKPTANHNTLPLSSEDLEFLSDVPVVHNANDEDDDVPLGKQKAMMESKQGAALVTPLTATPLRVSTSNPPPPQAIVEDDFDVLFNTPTVQPQRTPLQTPSRPSSSVSQRGPFRPPSTTPQPDSMKVPTNLLRPQTPSFPVVRMSSTSSSSGPIPFLIPPPPTPTSRPTTPHPLLRTSSPPITTIPVLQPPPSSQKPPETNLFDDDDEFSDFFSPGQQLPAANGTHQPKTLSFSGPIESMNPFGSLNQITPSTSQQPILRTASGSSSLMVSPVSDTADDAWGFDDFEDPTPATSTTSSNHVPLMVRTPPTKSAPIQLSASQQWLSKPSPPPPPVPSKSGSSTPSLLMSSPMRPPPKSQFLPKQRPPPFKFPGPDQKQPPHSGSHSRRVSAEDHSHTIQLMNNASKRGAWPAPLSPLPEALAPPPPPSSMTNTPMTTISTSKVLLDMGEEDGPFSRAQERLRPFNATVSVIGPSEDGSGMNFSNRGSRGSGGLFALPPPPGSVSRSDSVPPQPEQEQSLLDFGDFELPRTASIPKPTPPMADKSGGGLSAYDLSFFEGL
ncbi:hypothetical protein BDM02DRAFT_3128930 [Thelephora ganbajun]|uniref:Uncharacterized protein n=1 Tax=Thelephora ganbajun TaxID=370292 RepID=A0ACB6ZGS6_THEGA|nr:hypothetical protein BDM02DRAFT_3128930 [Thelephora ganbajun]